MLEVEKRVRAPPRFAPHSERLTWSPAERRRRPHPPSSLAGSSLSDCGYLTARPLAAHGPV